MDKLIASFIGLTLWVVTACQSEPVQNEKVEVLDSLHHEVILLNESFDSLNTPELKQLSAHVDTQMQSVVDNYPDPEDRDFWLKEVNYFGDIQKPLMRFSKNEAQIRNELQLTERQLKSLIKSIEDGKLTEEEMEQYYEDEIEAFRRVETQARRTLLNVKRAQVLWDSLGTRYDSIANHYRNLP